ncbi:MAG TPA: hypothetical protein VFW33_13415 [Gemmataceae bacterium]|nr:hypothetical protein [Gemmataceae bacterium]
MVHEGLLVVTAGGESIGKIIQNEGDGTFLAEGQKMFPRDFAFHYENNTGVCEEGALLFTLTEYSDDELAAIGGTSRRP